MTFDELCKDFTANKPHGASVGEVHFVTCYWRDSRQSINDLLRDFLKKFDIQYLNTVNGDVWFKGSDGWHNARHEVLGKNVRFYALIYPGQEEAKT